jgi:oligosaccharide 4-alpha-D-glucosyltransferase
MGNLEWMNKELWPAPEQMMTRFKKEKIHTILITEPFVLKSSANYEASKQYHAVDNAGAPYVLKEFYFGESGLIDIFRKDAQQWFWDKHKAQIERGVDGWWGDLGEPEKHPEGIYHNLSARGHKRLFKADEVHNVFGHYWTKMLYESFAREYPSRRLFSLNRSGFAGSQRYSIFPWTGDVSRSWSGLRAQLPVMLGMVMSGVPYVHADAGGFAGGEGDNELYIRWLQFAAFTPVFRPHGTALYEKDLLAFSFPSEPSLMAEPYRTYARKTVELRYKMLPYNYTLAYRQTAKGEPLVRPLYYEFDDDAAAFNIEDEFMWGSAFLIAPVLQPGITSRKVYLPKTKWLDLNNNKLLKGKRTIDFDVKEFRLPLFIREGSFVPYYREVAANTSDIQQKPLEVLYVPAVKATTYKMYNDDGEDKFAVKNKQFETVRFVSSGLKKKNLVLKVSREGQYPGMPAERTILFNLPAVSKKPSILKVNGIDQLIETGENALQKPHGCRWLQSECRLYIPILLQEQLVSIEISW